MHAEFVICMGCWSVSYFLNFYTAEHGRYGLSCMWIEGCEVSSAECLVDVK